MFKNRLEVVPISSVDGKKTAKQMRKCGSSHPEVFCKKCFLKNFAKFTGKHLRWSLFFTELQV